MKCFLCGCQATDRHHIFGGANRPKSEKDGLVVMLCRKCHNELHFGIHSRELMTKLRKYGQLKWERVLVLSLRPKNLCNIANGLKDIETRRKVVKEIKEMEK